MLTLKKTYLQVENGGHLSYGGCQMRSDQAAIRKCGCGPVAALDLLHYLTDAEGCAPLPSAQYNEELRFLCRRYFPLIPNSGINGLMLCIGVNRLFRDRGLPYRTVWAASGEKLWERIREMLEHDLPVILSVGPNFPAVWEKEKLRFYIRHPNGCFRPAVSTRSHYISVTGMDDDWLRISSWGREYYISRREYEEYVRRHSAYLFSNILYIQHIKSSDS